MAAIGAYSAAVALPEMMKLYGLGRGSSIGSRAKERLSGPIFQSTAKKTVKKFWFEVNVCYYEKPM